MKTLRYAVLIYIAAILLTACASDGAASLDGTAWTLTAINNSAPLPGSAPTLQFEDGQAGGNASCNSFGGEYRVSGSRISFKDGFYLTEMYCMDPEGIMDQELRYVELLAQADSFEMREGQLVIFLPNQQTLTFERQVPGN
jgi:heat shock protein HslJ